MNKSIKKAEVDNGFDASQQRPEYLSKSGANQRLDMISKDKIPWKLRERKATSDGALTQDQMSSLCREYGLDAEAMRQLSRNVDMALPKELSLIQHELGPSRIVKGVSELQAAIKALRAAEQKISQADVTLQNLKFKNPYSHTRMPNPASHHLEVFSGAKQAISSLRSYLEMVAENKLVFFTGTPDKRRTRDVRRNIVCTSIFNFWVESGRKLSYSTDPLSSERGGRLFDFVNAIVECISDPPNRLNGETIKIELDEFRAWSSEN